MGIIISPGNQNDCKVYVCILRQMQGMSLGIRILHHNAETGHKGVEFR